METDNKILNWLGEFFKVEEDKALHENKLFWLFVLAPLLFIAWLFYRLTGELITKGLYNPNISAESLAAFVSYYAFPIALLTLPLTLAVMLNRFHSSKQKAKSNRLVEDNNIANNYFRHFEHFENFCNSIGEKFKRNSIELTPHDLYRFLFPDSTITNNKYQVSMKLIDLQISNFEKEIDNCLRYLKCNGYILDYRPTNTSKRDYRMFAEYTSNLAFLPSGVKFKFNVHSAGSVYENFSTFKEFLERLYSFQGITNSTQIRAYFSKEYSEKIKSKFIFNEKENYYELIF